MRLTELTGTHASGTLQIAETALNDLLTIVVSGPKHPVLELRPDNIVMIRYGVLHARVALPQAMTGGPAPRLTLRLASVMVALALKALWHRPFLHVHGRELTIELASIPALEPWRDVWRHVQQLTFATVPQALRVGIVVAIAHERETATPPSPQEQSDNARMV